MSLLVSDSGFLLDQKSCWCWLGKNTRIYAYHVGRDGTVLASVKRRFIGSIRAVAEGLIMRVIPLIQQA